MVTVITSLNPGIRRPNSDGNDIGIDYQRQCLASWRNAGARVVSVNADEEIHRLERLGYEATFVCVETRSFMPGERPLPGISSAIEVAKQCENEIVLLTNSDIFFASGPWRLQSIEAMVGQNAFLVANRFDVPALGAAFGSPQPWGHDVFAFHASQAGNLDPDVFAFGSPWWDYWLPISALIGGLELKFLEGQDFWHMMHDQAWSWSSWNFWCRVFVNKLQDALRYPEKVRSINDFGVEFLRYMLVPILAELQHELDIRREMPAKLAMEMSRFVLKTIREASAQSK